MRQWLKLVPLLLLSAVIHGDSPYPRQTNYNSSGTIQKPSEALPLGIPSEAVRDALNDALNVSPADLPFTRWLWDRHRQRENFQGASLVLNSNSRDNVIHVPYSHGSVIRIDLRWYAPRVQDLQEWLTLWEKLSFDPSFAKLVTRDSLKINGITGVISFPKAGWWGSDSQGWKWRLWQQEVKVEDIVVIRFNPRHLQQTGIEKLQAATLSFAPIVEIGYFVGRASSTIKDKDGKKDTLFSVVWGGLYYDFSGIRKSKRKDVTDLDQLVEDLGIVGVPYQKLFDDRLRSDERAALFRSGVTGKPRRIDWFGIPSSRLSVAAGVIFITNDLRNRDVDYGTHPIRNLYEIKPSAFEVIFTRANGLDGYSIYGDEQQRLDFADANEIVSDSTVPSPHVQVLQPMISCGRCHGPHDGIQPFANDAQKLLKMGSRIDSFGDLTRRNELQSDTINRLAGWYSGNPWKPLSRARADLDEAVLRSTGPWVKSKDQVHVVGLAWAKVVEIYKRDRYDLVTPAIAIEELGGISKEGQEKEILAKMLPPGKRDFATGIVREDAVIAALLEGISVNRWDWSLVYADAMERRRVVR